MMSTPAATSVDSVRENRAIVTFNTVSPIRIGSFSLKQSHTWRPLSVAFHLRKSQIATGIEGMMMNQYDRMKSDACTTYCVSVGSEPPSSSKILTKIGTRNI